MKRIFFFLLLVCCTSDSYSAIASCDNWWHDAENECIRFQVLGISPFGSSWNYAWTESGASAFTYNPYYLLYTNPAVPWDGDMQALYDDHHNTDPDSECWNGFVARNNAIKYAIENGVVGDWIANQQGTIDWSNTLTLKSLVFSVENYVTPLQPEKETESSFKNGTNVPAPGDPVYASNGEYGLSVTDLSLSGGTIPLQITRTYGSRREYNGRFGYGWDMNYNMKIREIAGGESVILLDGTGNRREYLQDETETDLYFRDADRSDYIEYDSTADNYTLIRKNEKLNYNFGANNNLASIEDRYGHKIIFAHTSVKSAIIGPSEFFNSEINGGPADGRGVVAMEYKLTKITDTLGREITFTYDDDTGSGCGLLTKISHDGRDWTYEYDLVTNATNDLLKVTGPATTDSVTSELVTEYKYDTEHNLTHIYDPANDSSSGGDEYVFNTYVGDQVTEQVYGESEKETPGDSKFEFNYDSDSSTTTVTDREDNVEIITYNSAGQTTMSVLSTPDSAPTKAAYITQYEYNGNGEVTRTILPKRNCIDMKYDTSGNLEEITRRTETAALTFDGSSDSISVADGGLYFFGGPTYDFSVALWVRRGRKDQEEYIMDRRDEDDDGWSLKFDSTNHVVFSLNAIDVETLTTIEDTEWHYIVVSVDKDTDACIYVDGGAAEDTTPLYSPEMYITTNLYFGRTTFQVAGLYTYFKGALADVMILDRTLTRKESLELSIYSDGVVGYWKMDDNDDASTTVFDSSLSKKDGNVSASDTQSMANSPESISTTFTYVTNSSGDGFDYVKTVTDAMGNVTTNNYDFEYATSGALVINEVMASNSSTYEDPDETGEYPDWIEIYNADSVADVSLDGMRLTDGTSTYTIPSGVTVLAGDSIVFCADNETGQGNLHVNFTLDETNGGQVILIDTDGTTVIDSITYGASSADVSYGRSPDASPYWMEFETGIGDPPSPGDYNYTNCGNLIEVVYPAATTAEWVSGSIVTSTEQPRVTFSYYDIEGDDIKNGQVNTMTSPDGIVTEFYYYDDTGDGDNYGHLEQVVIDPDPETADDEITSATYEYDSAGNVKTITNAEAESTDFLYDELDQLVKTTYAITGHETINKFNENGKIEEIKRAFDSGYQSTLMYYNLLDNLKTITDALGNTTETFYDDNENVMHVQDQVSADEASADQYFPNSEFDERGLPVKTSLLYKNDTPVPTEDYVTTYDYDANGNLVKITDAKSQETIYEYDGFDRLVKTEYEDNSSEQFDYDDNGNLTWKKTRADDTFYFEYDALNRLSSKSLIVDNTDPRASKTGSNWDAGPSGTPFEEDSEVSPTTDETFTFEATVHGSRYIDLWWGQTASSNVTVNIYDDTTLLTTTALSIDQSANTGQWNQLGAGAYTFTGTAKVVITVPASGSACADAVRFSSTQYLYDIAGRVLEVDDNTDLTRYSYDAFGRLADVFNTDAATVSTADVAYTHDDLGRRTKLTYPDHIDTTNDSFVTYEYDAMSRLTDIKDPAGYVIVHYEYDELSRRTDMYYNNDLDSLYNEASVDAHIEYNYVDNTTVGGDNQLGNWLEWIAHDTDNDGTSEMDFDYAYDAVGNRKNLTVDQHATDEYFYEYDDIYQLEFVKFPNDTAATNSYTYDDLGNRTGSTVDSVTWDYEITANDLNQYDAVGPDSSEDAYTYDDNGNLIDDETYTYTYDAENRLVSVDPDSTASYSYDYRGRRISRTVTAGTTKYVYDGDQVIAEYDGSDNLLRKFIYGPGIDEPICVIDCTGESDVWYFYHLDGLGSVVALSNTSGSIVEKYTYDVFGKCDVVGWGDDETWDTGDDYNGSVSPVGNPYMFTARRYDDETGLYYYRARMYAPNLGRFLQPDPIGYDDGMNMYAYVGNNPTSFVDPFGLCKGARGFGRKLWDGDYFGTQYGASSTDMWAARAVASNTWYGKAGNYFMGGLSALWTPETYKETAMILIPSGSGVITKATRVTKFVPRASLGADGASAVYIKTTSRLSGRTIKVVQKVTSTTGKVIHKHTKYRKWFLWW